MGLFDAFKGMFSSKTNAPVKTDNQDNVTAAVNPMIPSSQPPVSPETGNTDIPLTNDQKETTPTEASPVQSSASPSDLENMSGTTPSDNTTSSSAAADSTTDSEEIASPSLSAAPDTQEETKTELDSADLSDESTNETPISPMQVIPSQSETAADSSTDPSGTPSTSENNLSGSSTPDSTVDSTVTSEPSQVTEPVSNPSQDVEQSSSQDHDTPSSA